MTEYIGQGSVQPSPALALPPAEADARWADIYARYNAARAAAWAVPIFCKGMIDMGQLGESQRRKADFDALRHEMDEFLGDGPRT